VAVSAHAKRVHQSAAILHTAMVNGSAGVVIELNGQVGAVMAFTFSGDTITEIEILADPDRLAGLGIDVAVLS
jgi:RNA polymerase sigma-70 factor (ECF subfamily)